MRFANPTVFGECFFAILFADFALQTVFLISADGRIDDAKTVPKMSTRYGEVDFIDLMSAKGILELGMGIWILGDNHYA